MNEGFSELQIIIFSYLFLPVAFVRVMQHNGSACDILQHRQTRRNHSLPFELYFRLRFTGKKHNSVSVSGDALIILQTPDIEPIALLDL
jgi:hypothetical protein